MKKTFAALLILSMLLTAVAVAEAADVTGTWYLVELNLDGTVFNPADMGMDVTIELREDGTATMSYTEGSSEGTWTLENGELSVVDDSGIPQAFTLQDGKLVTQMDEDGFMIFGREPAEGDSFTPAAPVQAAEEDFAGTWTAEKIGMDGTYYPASMLDENGITATIEGTTITLNGYMFSDTAVVLVYGDGQMSIASTEDESGMAMGMTAQLLEDGMLALVLDAGDNGAFTFYMSPAA